ncbi:MAG: putative toxin-antitoxin system toxin component, PIN family [Chloroflexi bacterium]|nr:putative toxin-antitoxin system toxin component, PIN family [Chloroflexota bacterium]
MSKIQIVIDTNIFIASLYSKRGYAYDLFSQIDNDKFQTNISVPLILEYEDVAKRMVNKFAISEQDIDTVIDYICSVGDQHKIFYLWRPFLKDPRDDMVLELAVAARCEYIVTYNKKDFGVAKDQFGISIVTPDEFLQKIGEQK